jgi:peptide chain release factor 1
LLDKLDGIENRYNEITRLLSTQEVLNDQAKYSLLAKEHADLADIVVVYQQYKKVTQDLKGAKLLYDQENDPEMLQLASIEINNLTEEQESLQEKLKILLIPKDPLDDKNVIMEIRAGTGGEEAALFAGDLFRMYTHYAESRGWKAEVLSTSPTELGGFKEIIFMIQGKGAYSFLKYESGVHRVQRVPETEAQGRIHTSAATVAVLPEAEEVDMDIDPKDLRIDVFRSSGHGGQSVNTTDSAVRVNHLPTGLVVSCQDEKSQHKNKDKALRILRARLLDIAREEQANKQAQARKSQVGSGDRSERIRTYNFPQGRCTDHRIGLTLYKLENIMQGQIQEIVDALILSYQQQRLSEQGA